MKLKDILIALFAILIIGSITYLWVAPSGAQQVPNITLQLIDGKKIELASLKGKPVLITFWATSCPGCIKEMPHLSELYHELQPKGLEIIGIAMPYDRPDYVMEMIKRKNTPYFIALDLKGEAVQAFGNVSLTPTTFLIDDKGKIVKKKIGEMKMDVWKKRIELIINQS
ncbi:MAG: TlpA family protein disulfide reductase [Gammaproteobacteria bacterium]|nr:TlpA family protein disulfide reductase [Gammaproteobacteria bacterium]MCW8986981.1 TlpA family protein disulfide reductase [Gammaproteobacteria bacterium]MCW9031753.1 TlpA family protein disulfide reductase [Gammaproteobacteria bacterium]